MSIFKKRKESAPAAPQFADDDPNSPLRKLPLDAQKEFLASSLTKEEVLKDWDIFMQCIYFQCRTAFEKAPPEVLKKRSLLQAESATATTAAANPQRTLVPSFKPVLTRKRSGTCPAIFPSESDKAGLEDNAANTEDKEDGEQTDETKAKKDQPSSDKDAISELKAASDRKRAKSSAKAGRESKDVTSEDAELKKVTRNKRSVSALKERDVKNREDLIKIEIVDSVPKSSSDGKIKKKADPAVDSVKIDDSSRKDSSSQLELKASTSSEKFHSSSEEKKKDESNKPTSLIASNSSVEAAGETIANAAAPFANEDKGTTSNTPKEGSPRESPKGDKSTASVGSDLPVKSSSSEKIKDKSKRKRTSKNIDVDIVTDKVLVIEDPKATGSKSTPGSPAPEKKHKKRSISNSSKKDKDKEKARSKTPDRERLADDQKSKLIAIPETSPLDAAAEKDKEKARRKSEGQEPNKLEKTPKTLVNGAPLDATKSQNDVNNGVLSNSNSKTTSVGTSTGTGKKRRSTSITLTEEELNQIFIKSNPKDFYSISHKIGKGAFATVHIGKSLNKAEKNKRVAIKVATLNSEKDKEKDPKKKSKANINLIANEIRLLNSCQHPNIVKHLGSYSYKEQIWTVMEYCDGGTLKDLLRVQLNENHIAFVLRDIISAVNYLHERKRIHRDLKSDNILLNVNADVKIADLGLSVELDEADDDSEFGIAGSRFWLAPEMIRGDGYGVKADIWSLGCVAIEMADGRPPNYSSHPLKAIFHTATKGFPGLRQTDKWSAGFRDFLGRCFEFDPSKRATASELSQHAFLKTASSRREMAEMLKMAFMLKVTEGLEY